MTQWENNAIFDGVCARAEGPVVYHYAVPATAHTVAYGSPLRAALTSVMNDRAEIETGQRVIAEYTRSRMAEEQREQDLFAHELPEGEVRDSLMRLADVWLYETRGLKDFREPTGQPLTQAQALLLIMTLGDSWLERNAMYVACASSVADRLSQWRAYGSCVMVLDAAIEFEPVFTEGVRDGDDAEATSVEGHHAPPPGESFMASDAMYEPSTDVALAWRQVLYTGTPEIEKALHGLDVAIFQIFEAACQGEVAEAEAVTWAVQWYVTAVGLIKDQSFIEEAEVRLVVAGADEGRVVVKVRQGPYGLAPYVELRPLGGSIDGLAPLFFKGVRLGPGVSSNDEQVLRYLLCKRSVHVDRIGAPAILDR